MYYFNLQDIASKNDWLTSSQLYLLHLEKFGYANKKRVVIVISKLRDEGILEKRQQGRSVVYRKIHK